MSGLRSAIDELASEDVDHVDAADLAELHVLRQRLEAQWLRRLAAFDIQHGWAVDGALSCQAWLRSRLRLSPGAARDQAVVARELGVLPVTAAALADGEISYAHARVIASADLPAATMTEAEPLLVDAARTLDPVRLGRALTHLRDTVDPDAAVEVANILYERRRLHVSTTWHGMVIIDGQLDPEAGEILLAALDALAHPDPPDGPARTPAQRRADALTGLARRHLDHGDLPHTAGERPHITVTVDLDTLQQRTQRQGAQLSPDARPRPQAHGSGAQLSWGGTICGETARRLACDAGITRVITDAASQPLDVGRRTRTIPAAIRRALTVRDGGCTYPGCDRPPAWTDAHHIVHWSDGGTTSLDNLTLLCRTHHRATHEGRHPPRPPPAPT